MRLSKEQFEELKTKHKLWLIGDAEGRRANLIDANLSGANLSGADLRDANLIGADLRGADLIDANLIDANLIDANLIDANLCGANLCGANLCGADLSDADLRDADLRDANLCGANLCDADLSGATGNRYQIKSMFLSEDYAIVYTADDLQIGCKIFPIADWWGFDDRAILEMDGKKALKFWRAWRDTIKMIIEKSPAIK